jgi:uncharacterized LabA/DUF88 family protein
VDYPIVANERVAIFVDNEYLRRGLDITVPDRTVDYTKLFRKIAGPGTLTRSWIYTTPPPDHLGPEGQEGYRRWAAAIEALPFVELIRGTLKERTRKVRVLATGEIVEAIYSEQRGIDVKLAIDMVQHALMRAYDVAVLISGDSDFEGLVKLVRMLNLHMLNAHSPACPVRRYYFSRRLEKACDRPPLILDEEFLKDCVL